MLAVVWPLIWPLRRRVVFLSNHNLQEAHRRRFERTLLGLMYRTGLRVGSLESAAGWAEIGIPPRADRVLVLPIPISEFAPPRPSRRRCTRPAWC